MDSEEISMKVAETLTQLAANAPDMSDDAVVEAYKRAEQTLLPLVSKNPELILELRRRVAEWTFMLLSGRQSDLNKVKHLRDSVAILGFSDLQKEVTVNIVFAEACRRLNKLEDFRTTVSTLKQRLVEESEAYDGEIIRDLADCIDRLAREV